MNGGSPVSSSNSTQPTAYTSLRASTASPRACSGDRYWAVPMTAAVCVTFWPSPSALAMPKSMTFTAPARLIMMLAGLTSRWMMLWRCEKSSAAHTSAITSMTFCWDIGPVVLTISRRVCPSTYSMTM